MSDIFKYLIDKENLLIQNEIKNSSLVVIDNVHCIPSDDNLINASLLIASEFNPAFKVHTHFIGELISLYINVKFETYSNDLKSTFTLYQIDKIDEKIFNHIDEIPAIIESLHIAFLNSQFLFINGKLSRNRSKHFLKESGAVYTLELIAKEIVSASIEKGLQVNFLLSDITCLDFACGTGRFYFEAVKILNEKYYLSLKEIVCNNLFAVDIDQTAISILRCKVISQFAKLDAEIINAVSQNIIHRNALMPKVVLLEKDGNGIDLLNDFKGVFASGGFDVVFSNPPYCLLKVNKKVSEGKKEYYLNLQNKVQSEINFFRKSGVYGYAIEGMLNYYQLSIEMIIRLTKPKGQIGIICPSSLFGDLTSAKLRKHILKSHTLQFIRYYPESARLFENVSQSTVIFYLQKGGKTEKIGIEIFENTFEVDMLTIEKVFSSNFEIPLIDKLGWEILSKISQQKRMKEISYIRNRRGELDLTLYKSLITHQNTGWRLVRGNMITASGIVDKNVEFIEIKKFLDKKSTDFKTNDFEKVRLVCQQISNVDIHKRLKFVFCEKNDILGNSCNYIVSTRKQSDLEKLSFILNSELLNWRFKVTSSNNHVNNYELDELPVIDLDSFELCEFLNNEDENAKRICQLYGLSKEETSYILNNNKREKKILEYEQETL